MDSEDLELSVEEAGPFDQALEALERIIYDKTPEGVNLVNQNDPAFYDPSVDLYEVVAGPEKVKNQFESKLLMNIHNAFMALKLIQDDQEFALLKGIRKTERMAQLRDMLETSLKECDRLTKTDPVTDKAFVDLADVSASLTPVLKQTQELLAGIVPKDKEYWPDEEATKGTLDTMLAGVPRRLGNRLTAGLGILEKRIMIPGRSGELWLPDNVRADINTLNDNRAGIFERLGRWLKRTINRIVERTTKRKTVDLANANTEHPSILNTHEKIEKEEEEKRRKEQEEKERLEREAKEKEEADRLAREAKEAEKQRRKEEKREKAAERKEKAAQLREERRKNRKEFVEKAKKKLPGRKGVKIEEKRTSVGEIDLGEETEVDKLETKVEQQYDEELIRQHAAINARKNRLRETITEEESKAFQDLQENMRDLGKGSDQERLDRAEKILGDMKNLAEVQQEALGIEKREEETEIKDTEKTEKLEALKKMGSSSDLSKASDKEKVYKTKKKERTFFGKRPGHYVSKRFKERFGKGKGEGEDKGPKKKK